MRYGILKPIPDGFHVCVYPSFKDVPVNFRDRAVEIDSSIESDVESIIEKVKGSEK